MTISLTSFSLPVSIAAADASWQPSLQKALATMNPSYLNQLCQSQRWLPGVDKIFNAFSLPMSDVNYVLLGESPYPRAASANGYAFWDAAVSELWSATGLSKAVNRATSLRNILKMLLIADGYLDQADTSQPAIAKVDKSLLVKTNNAFFANFLRHGFLLLNASLVLQEDQAPQKDAVMWQSFLQSILKDLLEQRPSVKFVLLGRIAAIVDQFISLQPSARIQSEHPYNISFITNHEIMNFFKPLHLLHQPAGFSA